MCVKNAPTPPEAATSLGSALPLYTSAALGLLFRLDPTGPEGSTFYFSGKSWFGELIRSALDFPSRPGCPDRHANSTQLEALTGKEGAPEFEVVVADNRSTDDRAEVVGPRFLAEITAPFDDDPRLGIVGGAGDSGNGPEAELRMRQGHLGYVFGGAMAMRREVSMLSVDSTHISWEGTTRSTSAGGHSTRGTGSPWHRRRSSPMSNVLTIELRSTSTAGTDSRTPSSTRSTATAGSPGEVSDQRYTCCVGRCGTCPVLSERGALSGQRWREGSDGHSADGPGTCGSGFYPLDNYTSRSQHGAHHHKIRQLQYALILPTPFLANFHLT